MRDEFSENVKNKLAERVGFRCSRLECRASTSGPQVDSTQSLNVGVAAHITAASVGGPRHDSSLSPEDRRSIENGIWLCQNCAKFVDNDENRFTAADLQSWKSRAEEQAFTMIGKTVGSVTSEGLQLASEQHDRLKFVIGQAVYSGDYRAIIVPAKVSNPSNEPNTISNVSILVSGKRYWAGIPPQGLFGPNGWFEGRRVRIGKWDSISGDWYFGGDTSGEPIDLESRTPALLRLEPIRGEPFEADLMVIPLKDMMDDSDNSGPAA